MQYARERQQNKLVNADDASVYDSDRYMCPVCNESVFLRRGYVRRAHFAHRPSEGSRECENYHPGAGYAPSLYAAQPRKPPPLPLYISVEDHGVVRAAWHLELLIPYNPESNGVVVIQAGISGRTRVDLSSLAQGGRRVRVRNQTEPYVASLTGTGHEAYRERFTVPVAGLDIQYGNVFRYGERGGRRLDPSQPLYWGRGYHVVWTQSLTPAWPAAVYCRRLKDSQPWQCASIELPPVEDEDTQRWVDEFLAREIRRPPVTIAVVSPFAHPLADDSLAVAEGSEAIIGVIREHGAVMPSEMQVAWPGLRGLETFPLRNEERLLVNLGRVPSGISVITLSDGEDDQITLVGRQTVSVATTGSAGLRVRDGTRQVVLVPAYSASADAALERVRRGPDADVAIVGVSLPLGLRCTMTHRETRSQELETRQFNWPEDWAIGDAAEVQRGLETSIWRELSAALQSAAFLELDFGNFGSVRLTHAPSTAARLRASLPPGLRARLRWLVSFPRYSNDENWATIAWPTALSPILDPSTGRLNRGDKLLVRELVSRDRWSTRLVAHIRAARQDVCAALDLVP